MDATTESPTLQNKILDRLVADDEEVDVEEGASPRREDVISVQEFSEMLAGIQRTLDQIGVLTRAVEDLRSSALKEEDLVALLYGKYPELNKGTIKSVLTAIEDLGHDLQDEKRHGRLLRLLLSKMSRNGKQKTGAVLVGLKKMARRYAEESTGSNR